MRLAQGLTIDKNTNDIYFSDTKQRNIRKITNPTLYSSNYVISFNSTQITINGHSFCTQNCLSNIISFTNSQNQSFGCSSISNCSSNQIICEIPSNQLTIGDLRANISVQDTDCDIMGFSLFNVVVASIQNQGKIYLFLIYYFIWFSILF